MAIKFYISTKKFRFFPCILVHKFCRSKSEIPDKMIIGEENFYTYNIATMNLVVIKRNLLYLKSFIIYIIYYIHIYYTVYIYYILCLKIKT
jgi:hypothetical protein